MSSLSHKKIRERIVFYETQYPAFRDCQFPNEVAMIYGPGDALVAFENYLNLKELLELA